MLWLEITQLVFPQVDGLNGEMFCVMILEFNSN